MLAKHAAKCVFFLLFMLSAGAQAAFSYQSVVEKAEKLATSTYRKPEQIPGFFQKLSYHDYQSIRFDPEKRLWKKSNTNFQVMPVPAGLFYRHPVKLNVVNRTGVSPIAFDKSLFNFSDKSIEKRMPADLGYAGFKLTYPFSGADSANQFLVFAGASYFRGVGRDNAFGISARGVAVDTGLNSGEEFPEFIEFWLQRPSPDSKHMIVYALLDGPGLTGAYQFDIHPGKTTRVTVKVTLFPRRQIELAGIAPLTSMFFYGENTARPKEHWRPEVHDSDGLLIHDGVSEEWLWRPLINPKTLQIDYLQVQNPRGFGLLQRDSEFVNYQDIGAQYQRRPNAWVEPDGDWGSGNVVLVQLPTANETNDNIVAFWTPQKKLAPGQPYSFAYSLKFGDAAITASPMAYTSNTFVGAGDIIGGGNVEGSYRLVIDFKGDSLNKLTADAKVTAEVTGTDGSKVIEQFVEYNAPLKAWRLSILAKPDGGKPLALRAFLKYDGQTVSETWTYRLPDAAAVKGSGS